MEKIKIIPDIRYYQHPTQLGTLYLSIRSPESIYLHYTSQMQGNSRKSDYVPVYGDAQSSHVDQYYS